MKKPLTNAQRVARSRAKTLHGGARRVEVTIHEPALSALDRMVERHGSQRAAIEHALLNARK